MCWLEICQQFYTTISLDQKFYTHKMHTCGLFSLTINQRKCINISNLVFFVLKFQHFQKKVTLGVCEITKYTGVFCTSHEIYNKLRCFIEEFTQLAIILQDRRSRWLWQISSLVMWSDKTPLCPSILTYSCKSENWVCGTDGNLQWTKMYSHSYHLYHGSSMRQSITLC